MAAAADRKYLSDPRRVNEFRKYYQSKHTLHRQPVIAGSNSLALDPNRPDTLAAAVTETDFTLGAYATCVVHSIDVDKVMVSLLDDTTQYFLGGATKHTSSVVEGDENPELWFGCNSIGIAGGICEVACSVTPDFGDYPFYIVPDIAHEPQWCDVVGTYRFYAGIPITTPAGYNIGTLFAFSTRPRPQLEPREKLIMERMAREVMNHLELELNVLERNRLLRMNQVLAQFTAGRDTTFDGTNAPNTEAFQITTAQEVKSDGECGRDESARGQQCNNLLTIGADNDRTSFTQSHPETTEPHQQSDHQPIMPVSFEGDGAKVWAPDGASGPEPIMRADKPRAASLQIEKSSTTRNSSHSSIYERAADMLRSGMECTAVVFLSTDRDNLLGGNNSHVTLLGGSTTTSIGLPQDFPAHVLRELLGLYPQQGHIFYFDSKGRSWPTAEDDVSPTSCQPHLITYPDSDEESNHGDNKENYGRNLARSLQWSIPSAQQILIVPLQNTRDDMLGVAIAWNDHWDRVMTYSVELPFTLSFCANIFAQISHQEAIVANRQKADFIANVSHELRSPLHGILATSDFLKETSCTELQHSLVEDVQSCGRVLLNTIDHVLDFSNLIRSEQKIHRVMRERNDSVTSSKEQFIAPDHQSYGSQRNPLLLNQPVNIDLAALLEDVADSVFISRFFHGSASSKLTRDPSPGKSNYALQPPPTVSLDIAPNDWNFTVQPGAIQRIIMNLLGNAIKYTSQGCIQVNLTVEELQGRQKGAIAAPDSIVTLVVSDSGRGLSPEYIRTRLWCAFAQEDQTVRGTGLGLSITKKIVNLMGGTIDLQSVLNVGTTVTVRLPLQRASAGEHHSNFAVMPSQNQTLQEELAQHVTGRPSSDMSRLGQGRTVAVMLRNTTTDVPCETHSAPDTKYANRALMRYLTEWFAFTVVSHLEHDSVVDLVIMDEERLGCAQLPSNIPRVVLKDSSYISADEREPSSIPTLYVRRPVAPRKLERALREIFAVNEDNLVEDNSGKTTLAHRSKSAPATPISAQAISSGPAFNHQSPKYLKPPSEGPDDMPTQPPCNLSIIPHTPRSVDNTTTSLANATTTSDQLNISLIQTNSPRVLVVDDNPINVKVLCAYLHKHKVPKTHVAVAVNGLDATQQFMQSQIAGQQPFDIVLMDLNMPLKDGFEATKDIRTHEKAQDISPTMIVALTGLVSERDQERAFAAGADQFFSKPFSGTQVASILDGWRRQRIERPI